MRPLTMHRLQELVRLHRQGTGAREVARLLRMSPNTERDYRDALRSADLLAGNPEELPSLELLRETVEAAKPGLHRQHVSSIAAWEERVTALLAKDATPTAIYDRLRLDDPGFSGSLSAVKRLCLRLGGAKEVDAGDVVIPVETVAGESAQVDFGSVGLLWDPKEKRMRVAYAFVMVLGHSRHQFSKLVFDQKVETWLALHVEAFAWFGGVPEVMVPDNLKSAVVKAAFDVRTEPVLNRSYRELARHYGFKIDPTPPYSPEKKGKVEAGVKYVKTNFMRTIGEERDVDVLNEQLVRWVVEVAGRRVHGTTRRRPLELFEEVERTALHPLPTVAWSPMSWRSPQVHRDSHVLVEKARYSVPWRLVGKHVLARVSGTAVELYWEDTRVATHPRKPPGGRSTLSEHLPSERGDYRHRQRSYWEERARTLGPEVEQYVVEVFDSDEVLHQLTKVQATVRHLETFPIERARAACRRASFYASYGYGTIKNILRQGLDLEPLPVLVVPESAGLANPRFARNVQELLDLTLKDDDASH
jgi:transposase